MKKPVKTQNGKKPIDDSYQGQILLVHYVDGTIVNLSIKRDDLVEQIKTKFGKSGEQIEFELRKLRKD